MRKDIPVLCGCVVAKISMDVANFVRVLSIYRLLQITPEMNPRTTTLLLAKLELMQIQSSNLAFLSSSFFVSRKKKLHSFFSNCRREGIYFWIYNCNTKLLLKPDALFSSPSLYEICIFQAVVTNIHIAVILSVTPCSLVDMQKSFGKACFFQCYGPYMNSHNRKQ